MDHLEISKLSDQELFDNLSSIGVKCGPVTETTRKLYETLLYKKTHTEQENEPNDEEEQYEEEEEEEKSQVFITNEVKHQKASYSNILSSSFNSSPSKSFGEIYSPRPNEFLNTSSLYISTPKDDNLRLSPTTTSVTLPETYIDEFGREQIRFVRKRVPRSQFSDKKTMLPKDTNKELYKSLSSSINKPKNNNNMLYVYIGGFIALTLITYFVFGFN